jgi:hypothetical protein
MQATDDHIQQSDFQGHFVDDDVVDLSSYRRWRKPYRSSSAIGLKQTGNAVDTPESDDEYRERMKVNAAAFAVIVLIIYIGIWLINNIVIVDGPHHLA